MPRHGGSRRRALLLVLGALGLVSARPGAAPAEAPKTVTVVIDGAAFAPDAVTARVGDTVAWTNKDVVDHTATDAHHTWRVVVEAGKTATLVVKKPGTFQYFCEFHPNMTGTLTVQPPRS